jgi:hypothetical protein
MLQGSRATTSMLQLLVVGQLGVDVGQQAFQLGAALLARTAGSARRGRRCSASTTMA